MISADWTDECRLKTNYAKSLTVTNYKGKLGTRAGILVDWKSCLRLFAMNSSVSAGKRVKYLQRGNIMENDLKGRIERISLVSLNLAWGFMTEKYGMPEMRPENPYHETEQHLKRKRMG